MKAFFQNLGTVLLIVVFALAGLGVLGSHLRLNEQFKIINLLNTKVDVSHTLLQKKVDANREDTVLLKEQQEQMQKTIQRLARIKGF